MHTNAPDTLERSICMRIDALLAHVCAHVCTTQTHLHFQYYSPQPIHGFSCVSLGVMQQHYLLSRGRTAGLQQTPRFCSSTLAHLSCGNLLIHPSQSTCHNLTCAYARTVCSLLLYMNLPQKGPVWAHRLPPLLSFHQCLTVSSLFLTHSWNHYLFFFLSQRTRAFPVKSFAHYLLFYILPLAQLCLFYPPTSSLFLDHCLSSCSSLGISLPTSLLLCLLCPPDVIETAV